MLGNGHVRFGGRGREDPRLKSRRASRPRPNQPRANGATTKDPADRLGADRQARRVLAVAGHRQSGVQFAGEALRDRLSRVIQ